MLGACLAFPHASKRGWLFSMTVLASVPTGPWGSDVREDTWVRELGCLNPEVAGNSESGYAWRKESEVGVKRGHMRHPRGSESWGRAEKGGIWTKAMNKSSGSSSSRRRQVAMVEGRGPGKWGPDAKGQERPRSARSLGWLWRTTCLGGCKEDGCLCARPAVTPHTSRDGTRITLGTRLCYSQASSSGGHVTQARPIRYHMPLATMIGSGMACDCSQSQWELTLSLPGLRYTQNQLIPGFTLAWANKFPLCNPDRRGFSVTYNQMSSKT